MSDNQSAFADLIRQRVVAQGGLPFDEFMQLCLYHPQYGYYMRKRQRIGRQGDFFTSSSVHSLFGRLIGRQLAEMWALLGRGPFTIVEQGAGEGHLALDILDGLAAEAPQFYQALHYILAEISPDNRQRQAEVLQRHAERVSWRGFEELQPFEGCFLTNELLDAFPVRRGEWQVDGPHELLVVERNGALVEEPSPVVDAAMDRHFAWLGSAPAESCRFELNAAALIWLRRVGSLIRRGFILTIDYGFPAQELYAAWRRDGTLRCYFQHQASDDPFQRLGEQDLTAHVDFTALQLAGRELDLDVLYFAEQYRFLMALGFVEELCLLQAQEVEPKRAQALRLTLKNLVMPEGGMGEVFKVLIQGKGVGQPTLACGRAIKDLPLPTLPE